MSPGDNDNATIDGKIDFIINKIIASYITVEYVYRNYIIFPQFIYNYYITFYSFRYLII